MYPFTPGGRLSKVLGESKVVDLARDAVSRNAWREAYGLLKEASEFETLEANDLYSLADSAWWSGKLDESIAAREDAYAEYLKTEDTRRAAKCAIDLSFDYSSKRAYSMSAGWMSRAERLLENEGDCLEKGYLMFLQGMGMLSQGEVDAALEQATAIVGIGMKFADPDLQAFGLMFEGQVRVAMGQASEGLALLDESIVAAVGGELGPLATGIIYCMSITATTNLRDYRRAGEWTEAAKRWCARQAISGFPGICRVHRAQIMQLRGSWVEAEADVRLALNELKDFNLETAGEAFYELGEIRLRMGDARAAEEAFRQAEDLGKAPEPGRSMLRLVEGNIGAASANIRHALEEVQPPLYRFALLGPQVEIALAENDLATAENATAEMKTIAETYATPALNAGAAFAQGSVHSHKHESADAISFFRTALRDWKKADVPYEVARTRVGLAIAFEENGEADSAKIELQGAITAFRKLGAPFDLRRALDLAGEEPGSFGEMPDRVIKTLMFTDIVGSTKIAQALGDQAWGNLLEWHDRTLRSLFLANGGEEVKQIGDGFFVAFEKPSDAVQCAASIQQTLAGHRKSHGFSPSVRIGLNCGEATRKGRDYEGMEVHAASRIAGAADPDQILAAASVYDGSDNKFKVTDARSIPLKGITEPVDVVEIAWR